ncbi:MAG: tRNA pseudouridine13 synthase [Planctomycetota bacterium]|nr:MAG: tRNA pseudouridine13 synthase [Planctomycetota bacterium]
MGRSLTVAVRLSDSFDLNAGRQHNPRPLRPHLTRRLMKLKCLPEDFQVTELTDRPTHGRGSFAIYRLTKRSLGTPEAIDAILQRWNLARQQVSYGGLKDRHAITEQFVTIKNGPRNDLSQTSLDLNYLGQTERPFDASDLTGNRFTLVLRSMSDAEVASAEQALSDVAVNGVPNYFDDQRFGSLGQSGEFIAVPWCRGDYERALWLALADPNEHDRPDDRQEKQLLRDRWGDWPGLKADMPRGSRRSIVTFLVDHPTDFRRALALMRSDLRGLWLSAFQSAVWNRLLAESLRNICRPEQLFDVEFGERPAPFCHSLDESQRRELLDLQLPLPSGRLKLQSGPLFDRLHRVLAEFGLEPRTMRVKFPRDAFFSKGQRTAIAIPANLQHQADSDELYNSRRKLTLSFDLPRGSYATILIKRLTEQSL